MKSGRTQVEIIALYEELGRYRAVGALLGCDRADDLKGQPPDGRRGVDPLIEHHQVDAPGL